VTLTPVNHTAPADRADVTALVTAVAVAAARSPQVPAVAAVAAANAARAAGFDRGSLFLAEESGRLGVVACRFSDGEPGLRLWGSFQALGAEPAAFAAALDAGAPTSYLAPLDVPELAPHSWMRSHGVGSLLLAPVHCDGVVHGLLVLDAAQSRRPSADDIDAAAAVATITGAALTSVVRASEDRTEVHRSQVVLGTIVQAATQLDVAGVLTVVAEGVNRVLGDATTVAYLRDAGPPRNLVVCGSGEGVLDVIDRFHDRPTEGWTAAEFELMTPETHPTVLPGGGRAVAVPLRSSGDDLGWVISFAGSDAAYPGRDLKIVSGIAAQAALSIRTALLIDHERAAVARLEELGRLKTQFVASVSHELRTPLTAIVGYTEVLYEMLDDPTLRTYLDDMRRESAALEALISDLLDTSRIEGGSLRLDLRIDDPMKAVFEAVDLVEHSHPGRSVSVVIDADVGEVPVDHRRLRQVVTNLIDNAVKYSPRDGAVIVTAGRAVDLAGNDHVEISVEDEGPGIPQAQREAVFQRFNRLTATEAGTGIGLFLVRALAEAHGGSVSVTDRGESTGSRFVVRIPAVQAEGERLRTA